MATKIQLILEGQNQASAAVKQVNADVAQLGKTAATATAAATSINTVAPAAAAATRGVATLTTSTISTQKGFQALRGVLTLVGFTAFPQLTAAVNVATTSIKGVGAATGLTTAGMVRLGVAATALAATVYAAQKSFDALWEAQNKLAANQGAAVQTRQLRDYIRELGESGELSNKQVTDLFKKLSGAPSFDALKKVREEITAINKGKPTDLEKLRFRQGALGEQLGGARAQSDITTGGAAFEADTMREQEKILGRINDELKRQQEELQAKLELDRDDIRQNKEWLELQDEREKAMRSQAEIGRAIRDQENEQKKKQLEVEKQVGNASVDLLGSAADAAKLFGREGFIAWKAFAMAQAIVAGALAVTRALAEGGPFAGPFLAAAAAAAAAVQIAVIATTQPAGFAGGGFTGFGSDNQPAGQVHKNEVVIPAWRVREIGLQPALDFAFGNKPTPRPAPDFSFQQGGHVAGGGGANNFNFALVDDRQTRREWDARRGTKVMLGQLARRGNPVRL